MFQFPRCPPGGLCVQPPVTDLSSAGLLHSGTLGSLRGYRSPRRFAASPRPSSAHTAQASTARPSLRTYLIHAPRSIDTRHEPIAHHASFLAVMAHTSFCSCSYSSIVKVRRVISSTLAQVERGIGCEYRHDWRKFHGSPGCSPFRGPQRALHSRALPSRRTTVPNDLVA
jgi:hypothetical protein